MVAHANGNASPTVFSAKQEADGYHVWFHDAPNPTVTVVKPNGDFYDVNGHLIGKYAQMSAPDGIENR